LVYPFRKITEFVPGQKFVNVTASIGSIAPNASRAFQPPIGAATDTVWLRWVDGALPNDASIIVRASCRLEHSKGQPADSCQLGQEIAREQAHLALWYSLTPA